MNVPINNQQDAADVQSLTYEQAKQELRTVVQKLETNAGPLEETLALWERGQLLAARCKAILDAAALQVSAASTQTEAPASDPF